MRKGIVIILLVSCFLIGKAYGREPVVFNLDEVDYFIYKNQRLTFSGLCNAIVDERKNRFIAELLKRIGK